MVKVGPYKLLAAMVSKMQCFLQSLYLQYIIHSHLKIQYKCAVK